MNCNCKIIRDLLPLYHDKVVSEESRELVEEHLKTCEECGKFLEDIHEDVGAKNIQNIEQPIVNSFKALKKRLRRKTIIKIIISVICAVAVVSTLTYGVFFYETPVSYSEVKQTITQPINSALDVITSVGNHNSIAIFQKGDTLYISCSDTFWTRYVAKPNTSIMLEMLTVPTVPEIFDNDNIPSIPEPPDPLDLIGDITKVFYFEGNFNELTRDDASFSKSAPNAVLLWEK